MTAMLVLFEDGTSYQTEKDELILGPYQRDDKPDFKKSYEDNLLRLGVTLEQALDARKSIYVLPNLIRIELTNGFLKFQKEECFM